ncbi:hypothetical protein FA13DRAFT_1739653 [Coprinellus micaceus]|jgi:hypothetical protein|uniref:Pheromone n=1 Tax=Coprinellus micaceus TaxID=71717 RepID=A0A4Y7SF98_COPMI|nr:hypothetical protein FA13DRAFT_1743169 [Coprinellus micaceus]TEB23841.1 hypothetical protein FA13DRAFT_1739653 [Coprinellus micaceus]
MDSFTTISFVSDNAPSAVKVPSDEENPGQGGGTYCVVFAKDVSADLPSDEENPGQGGGTYCTIA